MTLNASKKITEQIEVAASVNEIQVRINNKVQYVWFCNDINEARYRWSCAVELANRIAQRITA